MIVYLRPGYPVAKSNVEGLEIANAPLLDISSTFVRQAISRGRDMNYFLPAGVYKYIKDNKLYVPEIKK